MSVSRLEHITLIGVEQMGDLADSLHDPAVLRLENLDTDLRPPPSALAFTKAAVDDDAANSYLPFFGLDSTRQAAADLVSRQSGQRYDWKTECLISAGGLSGILNVLLATLEPGDEVLLTDPIYVGLVNRVRLAGGVPRYVPLLPTAQGWRLDADALAAILRPLCVCQRAGGAAARARAARPRGPRIRGGSHIPFGRRVHYLEHRLCEHRAEEEGDVFRRRFLCADPCMGKQSGERSCAHAEGLVLQIARLRPVPWE